MFFGDIVGLGLGAEHGFYYRWPQIEGKDTPASASQNSPSLSGKSSLADDSNILVSATVSYVHSKWQSMMPIGDQSWKESASMIMDIYVQRTHGDFSK